MKVKTTPEGVQSDTSSKSVKSPKPISIANEPQMTQSDEESVSKSQEKKSAPAKTGKKKR
jgi:hypothetical protein